MLFIFSCIHAQQYGREKLFYFILFYFISSIYFIRWLRTGHIHFIFLSSYIILYLNRFELIIFEREKVTILLINLYSFIIMHIIRLIFLLI